MLRRAIEGLRSSALLDDGFALQCNVATGLGPGYVSPVSTLIKGTP